jgi:dynein heavy chain
MDMRWEVFRWPLKLSTEIARQEKNFRVLEHQFKKNMEDEQQDFSQDIMNLQLDIMKLRDYTQLNNASKYAETVRRIRTDLIAAEEKSRLFNSRESLFNCPVTEYSQLADLNKSFEPFYDLWDCAEKWLSTKEIWTNGPFLNLQADTVENSVNVLLRNLGKSAKTFDRLGLPQCAAIASQVRDEVDVFRPKVPIILALRNPGMRDRHWKELADRTGKPIPVDKKTMTLQQLVNLDMVKYMADVDKVAEKAGKEFGIETALDKMAKAWESVMLIVEPYRDTGTYILKAIDEYMSLLDEHITLTQVNKYPYLIVDDMFDKIFRLWLSLRLKDLLKIE